MGELDNTLIFYIVGDNGSSAEGGPDGTYNEMLALNGIISNGLANDGAHRRMGRPDDLPPLLHRLGVCRQHAVPVDQAGGVPLRRHPQPLVVHWPKGIKAKGEVRSQFHHVIDVAPTVLEAARLPEPKMVNGIKQRPMDGVSMLYAFDDAKATDRRTTQYFEMFGNRAIYHDGWVASTRHSIPWLMVVKIPR